MVRLMLVASPAFVLLSAISISHLLGQLSSDLRTAPLPEDESAAPSSKGASKKAIK
jgi:hypothetical protein